MSSTTSDPLHVLQAARQQQFLTVVNRDEATRLFQQHLRLAPLSEETIPLAMALNRVLANDVIAEVDVPGFDRASVDGFAIQSADSAGASEETPVTLRLNPEVLSPGIRPAHRVVTGSATPIATGGMVPRGADAIIMIEHTELLEQCPSALLSLSRTTVPGQFIAAAGSDIARGETALRRGQRLTSREIGILAAIGCATVTVYSRPRVAVLSTGDELIAPGTDTSPGKVYDSNAAIIAAAVQELGGEAVPMGILPDEETALSEALQQALHCDMVILSGGTSKGAGDLSYRVVSRLSSPGVVVHGVALKPGKPICLAVTNGKPVIILPGFPTSAIFTFHEFVAPVLRSFAGLSMEMRETIPAVLPIRVNSERGRTEYLMVHLVQGTDELVAYPTAKGSGSVTAFSQADGFITIDQHTEMLDARQMLDVQLIGRNWQPADLVAIGSHCCGLDYLLSQLQQQGLKIKTLTVGSLGGLSAVQRGECDVAGVHLLDANSGNYNQPFLVPGMTLLTGYQRMQGLVFRRNDARFQTTDVNTALANALEDSECTMINRNVGSGTRILIDQQLNGKRPSGYNLQSKSHNAVAAAIAQCRVDWGVAIETVARQYDLGFIPLQTEHYDFVISDERLARPAVQAFSELLTQPQTVRALTDMGFLVP